LKKVSWPLPGTELKDGAVVVTTGSVAVNRYIRQCSGEIIVPPLKASA